MGPEVIGEVVKAAMGIMGAQARERAVMIAEGLDNTRRYPEWQSRRKTRGRRDRSLRARANRRKSG